MFVKRLVVGVIDTNCYIIGEKDGVGAVIDPGGDAGKILKVIEDENIDLKYIINTHGHFDHIVANREIKNKTGAGILIHEEDKDFLTDPAKNFAGPNNPGVTSPKADRFLKNGDKIKIGNISFAIIHTPGHSPGSISLYSQEQNTLFSGDTIFSMGVGRVDLPGGSREALFATIEEKILALPAGTIVFPGHGGRTTIGDFKTNIWEQIGI